MTITRPFALALVVLAVASCSSGGDSSTGPTPSNVASVDLSPLTPTMGVDSVMTFVALSKDASGNAIASAPVTWSSSDPAKATIDANGVAHGVAIGVVAITATSGTRSASTVLSIRTGTVIQPAAARVVAGGNDHACAIVSSALSCWGADGFSQIGVAATSTCTADISGAMSVPCVPSPQHPAGGISFASVTAGESHSCGLTSAGKAYCWGDNAHGQLGTGIPGTATAPAPVSGGLTFRSLAAGFEFTCGLTTTGSVYCWGRNDAGEVGAGLLATVVSTPQLALSTATFVALATGWEHACAIAVDGTLYCWGRADAGQLALATKGNRSVPSLVPGSLRWKQISAGSSSTCGLTLTGVAYCWGSGTSGQIGDGGTSERDAPTAVNGGMTFTDITTGFQQSCGIRTDGHAYCWGDNYSGELGDNGASGAKSSVPVAVSGGLTWTQLAAGAGFGIAFTCGVTSSSQVYCWGNGTLGQLGDGSKTNHKVPTQIAGGG
jgi:alpha-tubulin suppressor-like RCC1 family protein